MKKSSTVDGFSPRRVAMMKGDLIRASSASTGLNIPFCTQSAA